MGSVLWDDLAFEREFYMVPRDTYRTIPAARSFAEIPFDRWRELGADGLVIGSVERTAAGHVPRGGAPLRRPVAAVRHAPGSTRGRRRIRGCTRTRRPTTSTSSSARCGAPRGRSSTFASDRDGERVANAVSPRDVKEIYISDYDGANQRRVTVTRKLNIMPRWSPDARAIAYTSYRRDFPDIYVSLIYQGTLENPTTGRGQNWLPAWSPDGTRLCFTSTRDGNSELYVMNRDGSNLTRLTNHPAIDTTPTWSPSGTQIAFVVGSERLAADLHRRRGRAEPQARSRPSRGAIGPTWSPAPFNEIAYASRTGPGYDIRIYDLATQERRQLTSGEGSNESPAYAPERPPPGVHVDADGQEADLRHGPGRPGRAADHDRREQLHARLVEVDVAEGDTGHAHPGTCRLQS